MIKVVRISNKEQLLQAQNIRKTVFVDEQKVPEEAEIDEYEDSSNHYLAFDDHRPIGTARWRSTSQGIKLERFAVLREARGKGVGGALLKTILDDIQRETRGPQRPLYLHAQVSALAFYRKFGFQTVGDKFEECGIQHFKMVKALAKDI